MRKIVVSLLCALLLGACTKGVYNVPDAWKNVALDGEASAVMDKIHERDKAYNDRDFDAIVAVYAEGALIHYGRGEVKQYSLDEWKKRLPGLLGYWTLGGVEYSTYNPKVSFNDDGTARVECKYVAEWLGGKGAWDKKMFLRKVEGEWKIVSD